jgi:hypothetical protein
MPEESKEHASLAGVEDPLEYRHTYEVWSMLEGGLA